MKILPIIATNFLVMVMLFTQTHSQSLLLNNLDKSNFPVLKLKFYVFDANGNIISNLQKSDFKLYENSIERKLISVSCPNDKPPIDLSSVLTIDVSGSMAAGNLLIAKTAANVWIQHLNTNPSECAITSFDNMSYLNQDFTYDKSKLRNALNTLFPIGGTDYNAGFLTALTGGLDVCKNGTNKRIIIFLSDGMPGSSTQTQNIINDAKTNNISIYSVTLGMPCPQDLKDISLNTGGLWFENIKTTKEVEDVYLQILKIAQEISACELEWETENACQSEERKVEVELLNPKISNFVKYNLDMASVTDLKFNPYSLSLMNSEPGKQRDTIIKVTAINDDFNVTNISSTNAAFSINPTSFSLKKDQTIDLKVSVIPPDSGYLFTKFNFENDKCEVNYYVNAGFWGKAPKVKTLRIVHPNGGETFLAGSDTVITWEGITPAEMVKIEYTTNKGTNWILITDTATGLKYNWNVPITPSDECIARVTTKLEYNYYDDDMVLIPAGSFIMGSTGASNPNDTWEKPTRKVNITRSFLMSKYEVIQKKYKEIMKTNPSPTIGDSLPVEQVTWHEAVEYCNKLSELAGLQPCYKGSGSNIVCDFTSNGYRLPTEAEWEYACKAGSKTDLWNGNLSTSGCSYDSKLNEIGWYCGNSNSRTHIIGQKKPNPFGLYDMNGNVCEWVWDWQANFSSNEESDPTGPTSGQNRIVKGGSWQNYAENCRSANRHYGYSPDTRHVFGFRIVRSY